MKGKLFTIPNMITMTRIALIPVFAVVMFYNMTWGFVVFLIGESTDLLDGWVARRYNMVSDIGKSLDPVADKLTHITVMFCMSVIYAVNTPPFYILAIIIAVKELLMLSFGLLLIKKKVVVAANFYGKAASFTLSIGVFILFFANIAHWIYIAGFSVAAIGVGLSVFAFVMYARLIVKQLEFKLPDGQKKIEINSRIRKNKK